MNIAGYEKMTLQDYPGKVSAICFVQGCQLRCPYCHNPNLVLPEMYSTRTETDKRSAEFVAYVKKRKGMLDGIVLSGGEPLLQDDLLEVLYQFKEYGFSIKLDTNGMLPQRLKSLLDARLLDYVALDYKGSAEGLNRAIGRDSNGTAENHYENWAKSLKVLSNSSVDYELRTTVAKEIHSGDHLLAMAKELSSLLPRPVPRWFLQTFEKQTCLVGEFAIKANPLSAYLKEEMLEIKNILRKIVPSVSLRNAH